MVRASLPDLDGLDPEALKALVIAKHSESMEQHKQLTSNTQEIEHLKLVIEKYRRMIFGRKSEKLTGELEQLEFRLEELETAQAAEEAAQVATESTQASSTQPDSKRRSRPARKPLPEDLPREVVTHLPAHNCCPDCGGALRQFGEDVSEQLERIPASFKVIRHVRPQFACAGCQSVVEAPAPARPIDRGLLGPGLLAQVLVSKYADQLPLYRQSQIYAREGVDLDRSTLAGWVGAASELLTPLVDQIRKHVLAAAKIHADDTPVPVLAPGSGKTKTGRLWTYVRDDRPAGIKTAPQCGSHTRKIARENNPGSILPNSRVRCRPMPTRDFIISTAMATSMKSPAGRTPGVNSMTSTWPMRRPLRQKRSPASEPCTASRSRSAESPQNFVARSVRPAPGRCSMSCVTGWRRRFARSRPRARPPARSGMRFHTGVL